MRFDESFVVGASRRETWAALADMERVYNCLPGTQVDEVVEDRCVGTLRMKVGPISASYAGEAHFESRDEEAGELIIRAAGKDQRGRGSASAHVRAQLTEVSPQETRVEMENELSISGPLAQFGRGVISDVSREMLGEFASNLEKLVGEDQAVGSNGQGAEDPADARGAGAGPRQAASSAEPPAMDMGKVALRIARRRAPQLILAGLVLIAVVLAILWFAGAI